MVNKIPVSFLLSHKVIPKARNSPGMTVSLLSHSRVSEANIFHSPPNSVDLKVATLQLPKFPPCCGIEAFLTAAIGRQRQVNQGRTTSLSHIHRKNENEEEFKVVQEGYTAQPFWAT